MSGVHRTFSVLPDFLAAGFLGLLVSIADNVSVASSFKSMEAAADAVRKPDVSLPATSVITPVQPKFERPRRVVPWEDVQRLPRAVDTSPARGPRDHALLVMMSTHGFGVGEVTQPRLQDIDWTAATLKVVRPKTGVAVTLPLSPAEARALAFYQRDGRPPNIPTRHLFVRMKVPFMPLCLGPLGWSVGHCQTTWNQPRTDTTKNVHPTL
jgi:integrase